MDALRFADPEIYAAIQSELERQTDTVELIASENFTSRAVMEACGSVMTNKYAEGYPGKRYYGGCEFVDIAENLARERVKKLFGAVYANVQPHSAQTPIWQSSLPSLNPATPFSALTSRMADILRTAHP